VAARLTHTYRRGGPRPWPAGRWGDQTEVLFGRVVIVLPSGPAQPRPAATRTAPTAHIDYFSLALLLQGSTPSMQLVPPKFPPKKHGPASRRPRPSAESAPLSQPLYFWPTRPTSPPYPAPQPSPSSPPPFPAPLACGLFFSGARREPAPSHPGRACSNPSRRAKTYSPRRLEFFF
jgi:hypothetical protein